MKGVKIFALVLLGRWREICLVAIMLTSLTRIFLAQETRASVKHLSYLKAQEELALRENNRLGLEESVLSRPARLREYATKNLGLRKPLKIKKARRIKLASGKEKSN